MPNITQLPTITQAGNTTTFVVVDNGLTRRISYLSFKNQVTTDIAAPIPLSALSDVNITTPTDGQVLKYNSSQSKWIASSDLTGGGGTTLPSQTGNNGKYLTTDGANLSWGTVSGTGNGGGVTGLSSRTTAAATTTIITNDATENISITGFKSYSLLTVQTSAAAWVRLYTTSAARTSDSSRSQGTDPTPGTGVIAEIITTGPQTQLITPGVIGFNNDTSPTTTIYAAVTNLSGSSAAITVTLTLLQLEA
jgi:hypothetical protein